MHKYSIIYFISYLTRTTLNRFLYILKSEKPQGCSTEYAEMMLNTRSTRSEPVTAYMFHSFTQHCMKFKTPQFLKQQ